MRKALLAGVVWLAFVAPAQGADKWFTATQEPRRYKALGRDWSMYQSSWFSENKWFVAMSPGTWGCRDYGRHGVVRTKENLCDGRLVVTVRSVGEPTPVYFEWFATD